MKFWNGSYQIKRQTDKAILVRITESGREVWLPAGQITVTSAVLLVPDWLARSRGIMPAPMASAIITSGRTSRRQRFARECGELARRDVEWAGGSAASAANAAAYAELSESV